MGDGTSEPPLDPALARERFTALFGVSQDDLIRQGIDLDEYVKRNIHTAVERIPAGHEEEFGISQSITTGVAWAKAGVRAYYPLFATLGCLFVSLIPGVMHIVGLVAAFVCFAPWPVFMVKMQIARRRYVAACRVDGVDPRSSHPLFLLFVRLGLMHDRGKRDHLSTEPPSADST